MTVQTMLAVAPIVTSLNFISAASAADDSDAVARLVNILNSTNGPSAAEREEAALQLVNRDTPESRGDVQALLKNAGNAASQIAVAKAVALSPNPDPALIPTLGTLLGSNRTLTEAAAAALANYPGTQAGFDQLKRFIDVASNPNGSRTASIHGIGAMVDPGPPNAQYLIDLSGQANQNTAIKDAATEALGDMTGLASNGKDVRKWQQWWAGVRGKNPDQFKAMLLETRAVQFNQLKQRNAQLVASASTHLKSDYLAIPAAARDTIVLTYLNDRAPDIRVVGVETVFENFAVAPPTAKVRARLIAMIADSDDKVRISVVNLMKTLNDPAALNPLMAQLDIEKDPKVKQLIAQALGNLGDVAAVPPLLALLQDSQTDNVIAAAKAFVNLGDSLRQKDPAKADEVSSQIRQILKANLNQPGTDDLRAACMNALAALKDPKSFDTFMDCFNKPGESADVRRAALVGLGNIGNTNADQTVADQLDDNDHLVRLEAARALQSVATPAQFERIFQRMNSDPDPLVSQALWEAMQKLFDKESPAQLKDISNLFDKDPDKKLTTLLKLGDALKRGKDPQAVAFNEQAIADAMMNVKPPQIADAITHLQAALDYWRGPGKGTIGSDDKLETLIGQLLDDKLLAQQWTDATTFAADQISFNPAYGSTVGYRIKEKVDELIKDNKPADASKLIDAALAMKPALGAKYVQQIQQAQADLKQKP